MVQKIKFMDVGHGDSSIIFLKDAKHGTIQTIVIDIENADKIITELEKENIRTLDLLIISHFDADHCRGVNDFLEKFLLKGSVKNVCYHLDRAVGSNTMKLLVRRFIELYRSHKSAILGGHFDTNVQKRDLIEDSCSKLSLIYPNESDNAEEYCRVGSNNKSIVCILESKSCTTLFPGDLEAEGWERLLSRMPALQCDILKMPHHGAFYVDEKNAGTVRILKSLKPKAAIISTGENKKYRHPALETIRVLKDLKIKVYCTEYTSLCHCDIGDSERKCYGDIEVIVYESAYQINTEKNKKMLLHKPACKINREFPIDSDTTS